VEELLQQGAKVVVLSRGMDMVLQVKKDTLKYLEDKGVKTYVEQTETAVDLYNELVAKGEVVGGLFHSTC